jgi:multiple sugar transport system substrate-binding protein
VNYYVGLVKSGLAQPHDKLGVTWCGEALGKEKAAIIFEGNWVVPAMRDTFPDVRYSINPLPKGKQRGNLAFTVSYSMARDAKNKDAAWELIKYLTGKQGMTKWTSLGLALPSRSDVKPVAGRSAFLKAAGYSRPWQFAPRFSKVIDTANNELTAVFEGKESVDEMLKKVADAAKDALGG